MIKSSARVLLYEFETSLFSQSLQSRLLDAPLIAAPIQG